MRKNETGLTILEAGDVVRIGSGRVHYTVVLDEPETGTVEIQSHNTGKSRVVSRESAVLVQNVRDTEEWKAAQRVESGEGFPEDVPVKEHTAYQKAVLFALNKLGKHVYAGTVRKNVKAKRRGLNLRQKASRKANRP